MATTDYIVNSAAVNGDNNGLISILNTLSEKNQKQAEKILTAFAGAVND